MLPENIDKTVAPNAEPELQSVVLALRSLTDDYLKTILGPVVTITEPEPETETEEPYSDDEYGYRSKPQGQNSQLQIRDYRALRIDYLNELIKILDQDEDQLSAQNKIDQFYEYLGEDTDLLCDNNEIIATRLDVIKTDKSKSALRFIEGLSLIILTLITAVVPGLIVMGIVYAVTHRHVFDLFKTQSEMFEKNVDLLKPKQQHTFFKKVEISDDKPGLTEIDNSMIN